MKIERAVREKTYTLTSIAGPSGSGKTYSALLYARGLVGPEGKIGFIDTENKRSRFYADIAGGFDVIDLDPPFTSARYIEAIKILEKAGYTAIVIDSVSHEWEGTGGVLEQAEAIEQKTNRAGLHCWQKPKAGHKKMMNGLLQTRAHLIFCCRVKEKVTQVKVNGKTEIVNEGFVVVQEKSFIYEMTVSMMLAEGTHVPTIQKCPGDLISAFPDGRKITTEAGGGVRSWSEQGQALDEEFEAAKREGLKAAQDGTAALQKWWKGLGPLRPRLEGMKDTFKSIAEAADQLKQDIHEAGGGDPGERLQQARAMRQGGEEADEGFDPGHVTRSLKNASTGQNTDAHDAAAEEDGASMSPAAPSSTDQDSAASSSTADNEGDDASSSPSSPSPIPDEERAILRRYAKDLLPRTANPETSGKMLTAIEARWSVDLRELSDQAQDAARQISVSVRAIMKGDTSLDSAAEFFGEMLGVEPAELGGTA